MPVDKVYICQYPIMVNLKQSPADIALLYVIYYKHMVFSYIICANRAISIQ